MHTPLCKHATGDPPDYARAAVVLGLPAIAFTDHCPVPDGYDPVTRMDLHQFPDYVASVEPLRSGGPLEVLFGIEADFYHGGVDFLRLWLPRQSFDLVLGSVHFIDEWGFDHPANATMWNSVDIKGVWRRYFELVGELAETRLFDVVAHMDLPKKFGHRPKDQDLREMALPLLDRLARVGMAIELNTSGLRRPVKEIYPSAYLLSWAREREIPITFGSDAHTPDDVGRDFDAALRLARDVGYTHFRRFGRGHVASPAPLPPATGAAQEARP
jgi:histidinol-phosphatase (PHP family)